MPYEAVSAYTVLVGEIDGATTVTVHGSAEEAWRALAHAVRSRSTRWLPRSGEAAALADQWRLGDPQRRFWQVGSHQLQVMVPATGAAPVRPAGPSTDDSGLARAHRNWRRRWRSQPASTAT